VARVAGEINAKTVAARLREVGWTTDDARVLEMWRAVEKRVAEAAEIRWPPANLPFGNVSLPDEQLAGFVGVARVAGEINADVVAARLRKAGWTINDSDSREVWRAAAEVADPGGEVRRFVPYVPGPGGRERNVPPVRAFEPEPRPRTTAPALGRVLAPPPTRPGSTVPGYQGTPGRPQPRGVNPGPGQVSSFSSPAVPAGGLSVDPVDVDGVLSAAGLRRRHVTADADSFFHALLATPGFRALLATPDFRQLSARPALGPLTSDVLIQRIRARIAGALSVGRQRLSPVVGHYLSRIRQQMARDNPAYYAGSIDAVNSEVRDTDWEVLDGQIRIPGTWTNLLDQLVPQLAAHVFGLTIAVYTPPHIPPPQPIGRGPLGIALAHTGTHWDATAPLPTTAGPGAAPTGPGYGPGQSGGPTRVSGPFYPVGIDEPPLRAVEQALTEQKQLLENALALLLPLRSSPAANRFINLLASTVARLQAERDRHSARVSRQTTAPNAATKQRTGPHIDRDPVTGIEWGSPTHSAYTSDGRLKPADQRKCVSVTVLTIDQRL
jgi:hypothetical protein